MKRVLLALALAVLAAGCGDDTPAEPPVAGGELDGVSIDVHQQPD
jgi:hypothetical protein